MTGSTWLWFKLYLFKIHFKIFVIFVRSYFVIFVRSYSDKSFTLKTYTSIWQINRWVQRRQFNKSKTHCKVGALFKGNLFSSVWDSLIWSSSHVCDMQKGKQETLCTAADLPLFSRYNGIIGALGRKLVEKQRGFTDRFSLTYVSLSASYSRHNTS